MSKIIGWYYLHTNTELIFKRDSPGQDSDIRESDFAVALWAFDSQRTTAWNILVEALSLGANPRRIKELAELWDCDDRDAEQYANFMAAGFGHSNLEAMAGLCKALGYKGGKMWNATFQDLLKMDKIVRS